MRLLIISHTPHYYRSGEIVGWGSTIREIDHLSSLFSEVIHIAPLHPEPAPDSSLPYRSKNIRTHTVHPTGGNSLGEKLSILRCLPEYVFTIWKELKHSDFVHVRCPSAISLVALIMLVFIPKPRFRWVKYAGNWKPKGKSPLTYDLQRLMISRNLFRGVTTINGRWKGQPDHIRTFNNPCLTNEELFLASECAINKELNHPYRLLFVGRLESAKGVGSVIMVASLLKQEGIDFEFHLVGDGPERKKFESNVREMTLSRQVQFWGFVDRNQLAEYYCNSHFILLPSVTEGWPKVLSEGMAYGLVPLAGAVASIPQILSDTQSGYAIDPYDDVKSYFETILMLIDNPKQWKKLSQNGQRAASLFTYENYLKSVKELFLNNWDIKLLN